MGLETPASLLASSFLYGKRDLQEIENCLCCQTSGVDLSSASRWAGQGIRCLEGLDRGLKEESRKEYLKSQILDLGTESPMYKLCHLGPENTLLLM
jgi:hypothetical protein